MISFKMRKLAARGAVVAGLSTISAFLGAGTAAADKIKHTIAVFSGLDKITGRVISFEVATNETVQFGSLQITERVCYTRPSTEAPQTTTFVEVDEVEAGNQYKRIFSGWMFAASPGLHGIEHPIYDIWLTDCKGGKELIPSPPDVAEAEPAAPPTEAVKPPDAAVKPPAKPRRPPPSENASRGRPIEVRRPPGMVPERRAPSQSFFPTTSTPPVHDPAGNGSNF